MRKLFRFKYEPCKGDCYAWCKALPEELNKSTDVRRKEIIGLMVDAHNKLCDNPDYSFGIDRDEKTKMFVAHFRSPKATDTYLHPTFEEAVVSICDVVNNADIPKLEGACSYGDNGAEDLGNEILRACTDPAVLEEHSKNCPCHKAA